MIHSCAAGSSDSSKAWQSRVLMLAYFYPPSRYVGAVRPARLAKYLRRDGHEVVVLSAGEAIEPRREGDVHRLRGDMEHNAPTLGEKIFRKLFQLLGLRSHGWGLVWAFRASAYAKRFVSPPPLVFSTAPPTATHAVAFWLKWHYGTRWIADFRDPFLGGGSIFANRVERWLEKLIFRSADAIIVNTDVVADLWRRRYPEHAHKLHLIWNGFDPEERLAPLPLPLRDHKLVSHAGSVYSTRHPDYLFRALCGVIDRGAIDPRKLRIQFVGPFEDTSIPNRGRLERLTHLGCVQISGAVPSKAAQQIMATSDYLLLLDMLEGNTAGAHVPAKVYEYIQIGRPILACTKNGSAAARVLAQSGIPHVLLTPEDSQAGLEQKLLGLLALPTDPIPMAEEFASRFAADRQAAYLSELIRTIG